VTPVYKIPLDVIRQLVESVLAQTYSRWELCLVHAWPEGADVRAYLASIASSDSRVKLRMLNENLGISGNSNRAFSEAVGEFTALLDHDDTLAPFALFEIVKRLNEAPGTDFIYSDRDQIDGTSLAARTTPLFKPQWSPEIMLSANYLTHFCAIRSETIRAVGGWRPETDGAQDWDLFLRVISASGRVSHIPKVLYHWRQIATSVASGDPSVKPYAAQSQLKTVRDYCQSRGWNAVPRFDSRERIHIEWKTELDDPVTVIWMARGADPSNLIRAKELIDTTARWVDEVVVPGMEDAEPEARFRTVSFPVSMPLQQWLDRAAKTCSGSNIVLIDEFTRPAGFDWLGEIVGPLRIPEVGLVGGKILDSFGFVSHAGYVFSEGRLEDLFAGSPEEFFSEFGSPGWYRNVSAASGACLGIRREALFDSGVFSDPPMYPRLDVDLALRVQLRAGRRVLYNPFARFRQDRPAAIQEWLPCPEDALGAAYLRSRFPDGDPHFSPNLTLHEGSLSPRTWTASR
jgi:cellulose synthase/poly-beta-1,6-N-acetylglucosamine synthase-like glycosyltransferase